MHDVTIGGVKYFSVLIALIAMWMIFIFAFSGDFSLSKEILWLQGLQRDHMFPIFS
jgi:hypothetical protein